MIGKCRSTDRMTARTAATRDGGQANDAPAGGTTTSAARIAATAALLISAMLLLAACGGGRPAGYRDPHRLEVGVRRLVEQRLMTSQPREGNASSPTHVRTIRCARARGSRYACHAVLGDGTTLDVVAIVARDGRTFRLTGPR
jgi:hypothetical protein